MVSGQAHSHQQSSVAEQASSSSLSVAPASTGVQTPQQTSTQNKRSIPKLVKKAFRNISSSFFTKHRSHSQQGLPELVMQYVNHLKARYKIDIFPSYFSKHPTRFQHKANQYIKLAVVKNQKANKNEMELAQSLLLKTKGKVKEICEEQGYLTMEDLGKLPGWFHSTTNTSAGSSWNRKDNICMGNVPTVGGRKNSTTVLHSHGSLPSSSRCDPCKDD